MEFSIYLVLITMYGYEGFCDVLLSFSGPDKSVSNTNVSSDI